LTGGHHQGSGIRNRGSGITENTATARTEPLELTTDDRN
jgi:hypothetical protein